MRIVREDQNSMTLKDRNILAFIIGLVFASLGLALILRPDLFDGQPPWWSGYVGVLLGGFVVLFAKITTISLDKTSNELSFVWKGLTGKSTKEYNLEQIKEVELSVTYKSKGLSHHLAFVFDNGEIVPLSGNSSNIRIMGKRIIPEKALGARIASFLDVPFQEKRPLTAGEMFSAISSGIQGAAEKEMERQKRL